MEKSRSVVLSVARTTAVGGSLSLVYFVTLARTLGPAVTTSQAFFRATLVMVALTVTTVALLTLWLNGRTQAVRWISKVVAYRSLGSAPRRKDNGWSSGALRVAFVALLVIHGGLLAWLSRADGFTRMEPGLLATGIYQWRHGKFDTFRMNPPPQRMWAAIPAIASGTPLPARHTAADPRRRGEYALGWELQRVAGRDSLTALWLGRWMCIPISLIGMTLAYRWSGQLFGAVGALGTASLWALLPEFLGHAHLITADMAGAVAGLWLAYTLRNWLNEVSWSATRTLGIAVAVAVVAKPTWLVAAVLIPTVWILDRIFRRVQEPRCWCMEFGYLWVAAVIAIFGINVFYGFDQTGMPIGDFQFASQDLGGRGAPFEQPEWAGNRFVGTMWEQVPCPLPAELVQGIDLQRWDFDRPRRSYRSGVWSDHGWWDYYLFGWAMKLPIASGLLILAGMISLLFQRQVSVTDRLCLFIPAMLLFLLITSQTGLSKHLRYGLPILPFALIAAGCLLASQQRWIRRVAWVGCLWASMSSLWVCPHSLAYFNELAGGPLAGHRHLASSNVDWDQDLEYLKRWLDRRSLNNAETWLVSCSNSVDPSALGLDIRSYAIQVDERFPVAIPVDCEWVIADIGAIIADGAELRYLLDHQPAAYIGYGFRLYSRQSLMKPCQAAQIKVLVSEASLESFDH